MGGRNPLQPITLGSLRWLLANPYDPRLWQLVLGTDCHLRIGNRPVAIGMDSCLEELEEFLGTGGMIGRTHWEGWHRGSALFVETELVRDLRAPVPCVVVARILRRYVRDIRFYLDPAPSRVRMSVGP